MKQMLGKVSPGSYWSANTLARMNAMLWISDPPLIFGNLHWFTARPAWDNAKVSIISKPKFGMAKKYLLGQVFRNDKDLQSSFMNHNTLYHFLFNSKLGWLPPSWVFSFLNQQFMLTLLSEILRHHIKPCRIQRSCEF